jgi:hypothetical protein
VALDYCHESKGALTSLFQSKDIDRAVVTQKILPFSRHAGEGCQSQQNYHRALHLLTHGEAMVHLTSNNWSIFNSIADYYVSKQW